MVPGISSIEQHLAAAIFPLLLIAVALAIGAVAATLTGNHGRSGFFGVLSLVVVNVAGLLSGQYGTGSFGLLATLVLSAPFAVVMGRRETAWRRGRPCHVRT